MHQKSHFKTLICICVECGTVIDIYVNLKLSGNTQSLRAYHLPMFSHLLERNSMTRSVSLGAPPSTWPILKANSNSFPLIRVDTAFCKGNVIESKVTPTTPRSIIQPQIQMSIKYFFNTLASPALKYSSRLGGSLLSVVWFHHIAE